LPPDPTVLYIDEGYRTGLGISFYDRKPELDMLNESVGLYPLTIVYGPRNVGKSELVRYWAWKRRIGERLVTIEGDVIRSENVLEGLQWLLLSAHEKARRIVEDGLKAVAERIGIHDIYMIISKVLSVIGNLEGPMIVFIDEFHLLPRYKGVPPASRYEVALTDLEALAHRLSKKADVNVRFVLTVSEGFIATNEALQRLHGYRANFLIVDHLDEKHFKRLFEEYESKNECPHKYEIVRGLIGGAPGYLPELCASENGLETLIARSKSIVEEGLSGVRNVLRTFLGKDVSPRELIEIAYKLVRGELVRPLESPEIHLVGQLMTTHNIVYPVYKDDLSAIIYKPQIPVYRWILEVAVEKGLQSLLLVSPGEVLSRISGKTSYLGG